MASCDRLSPCTLPKLANPRPSSKIESIGSLLKWSGETASWLIQLLKSMRKPSSSRSHCLNDASWTQWVHSTLPQWALSPSCHLLSTLQWIALRSSIILLPHSNFTGLTLFQMWSLTPRTLSNSCRTCNNRLKPTRILSKMGQSSYPLQWASDRTPMKCTKGANPRKVLSKEAYLEPWSTWLARA